MFNNDPGDTSICNPPEGTKQKELNDRLKERLKQNSKYQDKLTYEKFIIKQYDAKLIEYIL